MLARFFRKIGRKRLVVIAGLAILAGIGLAGHFTYQRFYPKNPIPGDIRRSVTFTLYYPTQLPTGYTIDKGSFSTNGQAVLYALENVAGGKISVSLQQRPLEFELVDFHDKILYKPKRFSTPVGTAVIGRLEGKIVSSILTEKTWILVTGLIANVSDADVEFVSTHLAEVKK